MIITYMAVKKGMGHKEKQRRGHDACTAAAKKAHLQTR